MALKFVLLTYVLITYYTFVTAIGVLWKVITNPSKALSKKERRSPPACLSDPSLGTHEYVRANGIKFHYVTAGDKTKPLMLFLHGFPELWYSWRHQLREFSEDYHVVAVDMRGYGGSDKPPKRSDYTLQVLKQDVAELIPALGHEKCVLVGHDWGGVAAWWLVQHCPHLVEKFVVMNCPHPKVYSRQIRKNWQQIRKMWYIFLFQVPWLPEFTMRMYDYRMFNAMYRGKKAGVRNRSMMTEETVEAFKYEFSKPGALTPVLNYHRNVLQAMKLGKLEPIEVPTLIVWGDDDAFLMTEMADNHTSVCTSVTVRHIPNCSHWVQQDCPALVNQYMREFLDG